MNYGQLKAAVASESHRTDLTAEIPSFITRAEAMIARELRAMEMLTVVTLGDADRIAADSPIYGLPDGFLEERAVIADDRELTKVGLGTLTRYNSAGRVLVYAMRNADVEPRIEFRANPAAASTVTVEYFTRPVALAADGDTNRLLTMHDSVYLHAALFALYTWTQDFELAQGMIDTWRNTVDKLNEQAGRYFGGTSMQPSLNIGHTPVGRGY